MLDLERLRRGKFYDLTAGLPLILWFGYGAVKLRPNLAADARALLAEPDNLLFNMRFFALAASIAFNLLLIYLVLARSLPVRRARGIVPRLCGFAGTFLGWAYSIWSRRACPWAGRRLPRRWFLPAVWDR